LIPWNRSLHLFSLLVGCSNQTALNLTNPLIPKYLIGFATTVILEFAPTFISVIMAGKMGSLSPPV
jgi:hypothetical protein